MGNTGIAMSSSTGAVFYNPAGLATLTHPSISLSGSNYMYANLSANGFAYIDNTSINYGAKAFLPIPSIAASTFRLFNMTEAVSIVVPSLISLENQTNWKTPNTNLSVTNYENSQQIRFGSSLGFFVPNTNEKLSFGFTIFVVRNTEVSSQSLQLLFPNGVNSGVFSQVHANAEVWGINSTIGFLYRPDPQWNLGIKIETPLLQLYGKADTYNSNQTFNSGTLTGAETPQSNLNANFDLPLDLGLGASYSPIKSLQFLLDLSFQFANDYIPIENDADGHITSNFTPRLNVGTEWTFIKHWNLLTGYFYNPSAMTGANEKDDWMGFTSGLNFERDQYDMGAGTFYSWSEGHVAAAVDPTKTANVSTKIFGAFLTTSYHF